MFLLYMSLAAFPSSPYTYKYKHNRAMPLCSSEFHRVSPCPLSARARRSGDIDGSHLHGLGLAALHVHHLHGIGALTVRSQLAGAGIGDRAGERGGDWGGGGEGDGGDCGGGGEGGRGGDLGGMGREGRLGCEQVTRLFRRGGALKSTPANRNGQRNMTNSNNKDRFDHVIGLAKHRSAPVGPIETLWHDVHWFCFRVGMGQNSATRTPGFSPYQGSILGT